MNWDMTDWAFGAAGGLIIGLSSALYLLFNGRIAGVSGILGGLFGDERAERAAFLIGLIGAPVVYTLVHATPTAIISASTPVLALAGLLVGFGVRMGGGCTSGHGVCGLSRFSTRSLVGVATFMAVGVLTVTIVGG